MDKIKILQFGDVHFDTPFSELDYNDAEKRREDIRETFGNIIRLAEEEKVQIILITGDLFDNESVENTTIDYLTKTLSRIPHIKIFIAPGNHDPINERTFYKIIKWPSNVHVFNDVIDKVIIEELKVAVYGIGFNKPHIDKSLLEGFKPENKDIINLMVIHGDVNSEGKSLYNPISENQIRNSELDYIAIGHKHSYSGINRAGSTFWAYAGNPEGRGFDETGSKGVIIGEIGKGFNKLNFKETCKRRYIEKNIDITGASNYEDIIDIINENIDINLEDDNLKSKIEFKRNNLFKFVLTGRVNKDFYINLSVIKEKLVKEFFFVKLIDTTEPYIDYEVFKDEYSLKSIYIKKIKERKLSSEIEERGSILQDALIIGLKCLEDKEVNIDDD
jgi:DNA repair exonuclease SbcCD nuclease subunit